MEVFEFAYSLEKPDEKMEMNTFFVFSVKARKDSGWTWTSPVSKMDGQDSKEMMSLLTSVGESERKEKLKRRNMSEPGFEPGTSSV
jgi:hypothetical protein